MSAASGAAVQPLSLPARSGAEKPSDPTLKTPFFSSSFLPNPSKILPKCRWPTSSSSSGRHVSVVPVSMAVKEKEGIVKSKISSSDLLITREEGLVLYEDMVLGRSFETMCAQVYLNCKGKMHGFVHLYNGQEAVSTGFIKLLNKDDSICSTYRDHVHALSKGVSVGAVMAELFGRSTGCCRSQGGSMHMFSKEHNFLGGYAFIGEGIPVATGAAFASKYHREVMKEGNCDDVTVAFFGVGPATMGNSSSV